MGSLSLDRLSQPFTAPISRPDDTGVCRPGDASSPSPEAPAQQQTGFSDQSSFTPAQAALVQLQPPSLDDQMAMRVDNTQHVDAMNKTGVQAPEGAAQTRAAEMRTVPPEQQPVAASRVKRMLNEKLSQLDPYHREQLKPLVKAVGRPDFYDQAAKLDPAHADQWHEMTKVQAGFAAAEPGYDDKTRAYSESMRMTLHAGAVMQFASDPNHTTNRYDDFIAGHVTAFRENGGWLTNNKLGAQGSADVLRNTPLAMGKNAATLAGAVNNDDLSMRTAAEMVRRARGALIDVH